MASDRRQSIAEIRCELGELGFTARIGGLEERIHFRTETELTPGPEAALAACLMPAMRDGGALEVEAPLSPRLLRGAREFEAIQRAWSQSWEPGPALAVLELLASPARRQPRAPTGRVAAFFSGGAGSRATVLGNPDVTDLIFVRGFDVLPQPPDRAGPADAVEPRLRGAAEGLGLDFHVVDTNVRELSDRLVPWETCSIGVLAAAGLFLEPLFDRVLFASGADYAAQEARGGNRLAGRLWSTEWTEIADYSGHLGHKRRTEAVAKRAAKEAEPLDQEIADLRAVPGEVSFEARVGGESKRIWFRGDLPEGGGAAEAALATCLMPAMRHGGSLKIDAPLSPRMVRGAREFGEVQRAWSAGWTMGGGPLRELELLPASTRPRRRQPTGRVGAFFSGGVDSFALLASEPEVTDAIFIRGADIVPSLPHHATLADETEPRLRQAAADLGLTLHVIETNLRQLSDPLIPWEYYFACPLVAAGLLLEPLLDRVLIAGDADYLTQMLLDYGAIWNVERLWGTESLEVNDWGGRLDREQRHALLVDNPAAQRALRVCWRNPGGAYNCGRCSKCSRTMLSFEAWGVRERFTTFPPELDLDNVARIETRHMVELVEWEDTLRTMRESGRRDLERAVEPVIASGKRALGLEPGFRTRPGAIGPLHGTLFASAETVEALERADAVALLVGGYDGSGNFGDIAQLDATLEMLAPLEEELLILPVLELSRTRDHAELTGPRMSRQVLHPLFMGPGEPRPEDGLIPVAPPAELEFAALFLYGGGYLNRSWGRRKLDMLAAAEEVAAGARRVRRVGSGLQAEREWLAGLEGADRRSLAAFELLGSRDPESGRALAELASEAECFESGDDAVGVLAQLPRGAEAATGAGVLRVNVHFSELAFVSDEPERVRGFLVELLAALGRETGRSLLAQPLIAYLDHHYDERPGVEKLRAECTAAGIEVAEPLVLASAGIESAGAAIAAAELTLACSYHVALTSLMAGVPTVAMRENGFYAQKVAGLQETLGLPAELAVASGEDARECARRVAALALDEERGPALRAELRERSRELAERRHRAEARLRSRLSPSGPRHEIADLRAAPGELGFTARLDGRSHRLWIKTDSDATPPADAALAACLMAAMRSGGRLTTSDPVSPRLLRNQREYQAIQAAWSQSWDFGQAPLHEVEVQAPPRGRAAASAAGRVAAFFSGGVDSWSTVLTNPDVTDLIFVRGFDLVPGTPDERALADEIEERVRAVAAELGLELHVAETNARALWDPLIRWEAYNPTILVAVALCFEPLFDRVLIAGDTDHLTQVPLGASRMVDQLWSTELLEIVDDGGRLTREQRLEGIASHPLVQRTLRVCWENRDGAYNCCRCRKCLLTMISLEAIGMRDRFASFPGELDLELLSGFAIPSPISLILWEDALDTTRRHGRADLEGPVEDLVERGRAGLGLGPTYRSRNGAGAEGLAGALRDSKRRIANSEREAAEAREQLDVVLGSRSWRLTEPLRRARAELGRLRARRSAKG